MSITKRIDNITLVREHKSVLPAPKAVKIELSGRCNYRCSFCALTMRGQQPTKDINWELFQRITKEMKDAGVEEIGLFFLGESFMNPTLLVNAIRWCKDIGISYVFLTTNGSLSTPERVEACMQAGLDSLKFSVNTYSEAQFEEIIQVKAKLFERVFDNIREAKRIRDIGGYKCGLYASSIMYDGEQQKLMEELLKEKVIPYVDEHYWLPLYTHGGFTVKREEELGFKPTAGNQGRMGALRPPLPCWSVMTEGHVDSYGRLSACCFDATGTWIMADLNNVSFMEGWNSEEFVRLREAHLRKDVTGTPCENCIAYRQ